MKTFILSMFPIMAIPIINMKVANIIVFFQIRYIGKLECISVFQNTNMIGLGSILKILGDQLNERQLEFHIS